MHIFRVSIFKPSELISKKTDSERAQWSKALAAQA